MIRERHPWRGRVRVAVFEAARLVSVEEFPNLITDAGKSLTRDVLGGFLTDGKIKYLAWGTSSAAPNGAQVKLSAEVSRKAVVAYFQGVAGVLTSITHLATTDAVGVQIEELGWFAGAGATATKDSGVMIARVLYSKLKASTEAIQVDRVDDFS